MSAPETPATDPTTRAAGPGSVAGAVRRSGRLRNGELRAQVAEFLADRPGAEFAAGKVARGLSGRSSGAVGNALALLASRGEAEQTTARPLRYRATGATAAAPTPSRPAAPSSAPRTGAARVGPTRPPAATPSGAEPMTGSSPAAGTASAGSESVTMSGPVRRPNGQMYHPRLLSGVPDVTALRKLRIAGVPALLYGPPGTGKTSVVEAAFGDLVTVPGDGDTTVADVVGEYTQTPEGRYVFVHGPL